jgi:hypothetical protein
LEEAVHEEDGVLRRGIVIERIVDMPEFDNEAIFGLHVEDFCVQADPTSVVGNVNAKRIRTAFGWHKFAVLMDTFLDRRRLSASEPFSLFLPFLLRGSSLLSSPLLLL